MERLERGLKDAPDELTAQSGILSGPNGAAMFLSPAWNGNPAAGEKAIDELLRLGTPLLSQVAPMTYSQMLGLFDPSIVDGRHYAIRTRSVADFTPDLTTTLTEADPPLTSPQSIISVHHFHGASARIPLNATAFGTRQQHFAFEIVAAWEPDDADADQHRAWADSLSTALAPHALPGGYPGLLGPDDREQIARAYGPNAPRLHAAKTRYDPSGTFAATAPPQA